MSANPYEPPRSLVGEATLGPGDGPGIRDFRRIMVRWERLRIVYNAILIPLVVVATLAVFPHHLANPGYWAAIVLGGAVSNLCFLVGPAIDGYLACFNVQHPVTTSLIFLSGTGFTGMAALAGMASFPG